MSTQAFVQSKFAEFYKENAGKIETPTSIERREFGFFLFKEGIMARHKGFATVDALRSASKQTVPAHVYYSTAYYEAPEAKMEEKGWLGADLYFDIDADHIPTKCGKTHDTWTCKKCDSADRGAAPAKCPKCGGERFDEKTWCCEVCLESAKMETMKLVDMLMGDFGFSSEEVHVSFSGNRGYHVHVDTEDIRSLDSVGRMEIVDYVSGIGLEPKLHGLISNPPKILSGPKLGDVGWRGRIAKGTYEFFQSSTEEDLKRTLLKKKTKAIDEIIKNKNAVLDSWKKSGPWGSIKGVSIEDWKAIVQRGVEGQSAKIDTVVTTDIHRLIRLAGTLHGKTGLLKVAFPTDDLEEFDPLKSAVAFKRGEASIYVEEAPKFRLGEESFGPFTKQKAELPLAAALFLLCKNAASVVD
jgi:DNA primase small subunit